MVIGMNPPLSQGIENRAKLSHVVVAHESGECVAKTLVVKGVGWVDALLLGNPAARHKVGSVVGTTNDSSVPPFALNSVSIPKSFCNRYKILRRERHRTPTAERGLVRPR